jgi:hypothetical protein
MFCFFFFFFFGLKTWLLYGMCKNENSNNFFCSLFSSSISITWFVHSHSCILLLLVLDESNNTIMHFPSNLFLMVLGYMFTLLFISCFLKECYEEKILFCNLHGRTLFYMISLSDSNKYSGPAHCL